MATTTGKFATVPPGPLTTHVLNTATGFPASNLLIKLYRMEDGEFVMLNSGSVNSLVHSLCFFPAPTIVSVHYTVWALLVEINTEQTQADAVTPVVCLRSACLSILFIVYQFGSVVG